MHDLIAFVRACLDREEQVARAAASKFGFDEGPGTGRWTSNPSAGAAVEDAETFGIVVYNEGAPTEEQAEHIAMQDPAHTLARIASDRKILALHSPGRSYREDGLSVCAACRKDRVYPCQVARVIAGRYAGWPGWREEWAA